MLKKTILSGTQAFVIFEHPGHSFLLNLVIFASLFNLIITSFFGIVCNYRYTTSLAYALVAIYTVFFSAAVIDQIMLLA